VKYKLNAVRIYVTDWERWLEFYSKLLDMPIAFASLEMGGAEFDTGEAHLALPGLRQGCFDRSVEDISSAGGM
jgi:predicted enzyme related to lactoylglutathione lyase